MASNGLPEGWSYEGPDESVGIFGESFIHETCTVEDAPDAEQTWPDSTTLRLECVCGVVVELEAPDPEPEWHDEDEYYAPEKY